MTLYKLLAWIGAAFSLTIIMANYPAFARQESQPELSPATDIVVALDQSGSLFDNPPLWQGTDPNGIRIDAVKTLVQTLGLYANSVNFRFGLVEFGSPQFKDKDNNSFLPRLAVPLTNVSTNTHEPIISQIQSHPLDGTDFTSALCLSWMAVTSSGLPFDFQGQCPIPAPELAKIPLAPADPNHRRIVILFTDGYPAPDGVDLQFSSLDPGANCPSTPGQTSSGHAYMCNLALVWAGLTSVVPVELYVIGLDSTNQWWPTAEPYWRTVTGCGDQCSLRVTRAPDTSALVDTLVAKGLTPPGSYHELCNNAKGNARCEIGPFVAESQFIIRSSSQENRIMKPDGTEVTPDNTRVTINRGNGIEIWQIKTPESGTWSVQSKDPNANLYDVLTILTPARLNLYAQPERLVTRDQFTVTGDVVNPQGDKVLISVSSTSKPIDLTLKVTGPSIDGKEFSERLTGTLDVNQPNEPSDIPETASSSYEFMPSITAQRSGTYHLQAELNIGEQRIAVGEMNITVVDPPQPKLALLRIPNEGQFLTEQPLLRLSYPLTISEPIPLQFALTLMDPASGKPVSVNRRFLSTPQMNLIYSIDKPCTNNGCETRVPIEVVDSQSSFNSRLLLPSEWINQKTLTVTAEGYGVLVNGESWHETSQIMGKTKQPEWSLLWTELGIGFWSPAIILLLLLGILSVADASLSKPLTLSYRTLGAKRIGSSSSRLPLLRGGVLVWRSWRGDSGNLRYVVARRWLIFGNLTVRAIPSAEAFRDLKGYCSYDKLRPIISSITSGTLLGVKVKNLGTIETNGFLSGTTSTRPRFDIGIMAK